MPYTSPLENAAVVAAAKVRSKIIRSSHDRYPWLFISPESKNDVKPVVECWLEDKANLQVVSDRVGKTFNTDPWKNVVNYYPIIWTQISGKLESPFPGKQLVIVGLEYVNENNGLPKISKDALAPGESVSIPGDDAMELSHGGGGTSLFIILDMS